MRIHQAVMIVLATGVVGCGGGGSSNPSQPSNPTDTSQASFALAGAGRNTTKNYSGAAGNLIFCRREDPLPNTIWVRLAEQRNADGEQSPHIDIDLCNFAGSGTYQAIHDTSGARTCSQGQTFAIWWHEGSDVFVSKADASGCSVTVTRSSEAIDGTFQCHGLTPFSGGSSPALDVNAGSFHCAF